MDQRPPQPPARDADVVVVGAGAAGAAAFLEASAAGATVVGLDALDAFGGTAATSGGGCCIAGTPLQASRGIVDTPDLALRDLIAAGDGEADERWGRFYFEHARRDVHDWLVDRGVSFVDVRPQEHNSVPRWHLPKGNGRGLLDALWQATERAGLAHRWRWSARIEDLIIEDGRVCGVRLEGGAARAAGDSGRDVRGRAVVLATGGFAGDLEQILEHVPALRSVGRLLVGGGIGARGDGHTILARHGAALTHLDCVWTYAYATPDDDAAGLRGLVVRGIDDAIWVNRQGRRFLDESLPGPGHATPALLAEQPPTCWAILDRPMALAMRIADPRFRSPATAAEQNDELLRDSPYINCGDTPEELARVAGIEPDGLAATLRDWRSLLADGADRDPLTGRPLAGLRPYVDGPLYAMQFFPLVRKNLGGVRTDLRGRVLDAGGRPIPGLYAAGELAGFGGGHMSGRRALEGIMIGGSIFSGRVAGAWSASDAGRPTPTHFTDAEADATPA
jgi:predicted oxidoreductase